MKVVIALVVATLAWAGPASSQVVCWWDGCDQLRERWRAEDARMQHEMRMRQLEWDRQQQQFAAQQRHLDMMDAQRRQQQSLDQLNNTLMNQNYRPWCGVGMRC